MIYLEFEHMYRVTQLYHLRFKKIELKDLVGTFVQKASFSNSPKFSQRPTTTLQKSAQHR